MKSIVVNNCIKLSGTKVSSINTVSCYRALYGSAIILMQKNRYGSHMYLETNVIFNI
jgi:hypothetical protein